jgi:hypothetical protein
MDDPSPESRLRSVVVVIVAASAIVGLITLSVVYGKGNPLTGAVGRGIAIAIGVGVVAWFMGRRSRRRVAQLEHSFPGSQIVGLLPFRSVRAQIQQLRSRLHQDAAVAHWGSTSRPSVVVDSGGLSIWLANMESPLLQLSAEVIGEITPVNATIRGTWIPINERAHAVRLSLHLPDGPGVLEIPVDAGVGTSGPVKAGSAQVVAVAAEIARSLGRA